MSKKIKIVLLVLVGVILTFTILTYMNTGKTKKTVSEQKFMEVSEIANADKDFYKISPRITKDKTKINVKNKKITTTSVYLDRLKEIFNMENLDIKTLDKAMNDLLMDKDTSRIDKIYGLWALLNEVGFNAKEKKPLFVRIFSNLTPYRTYRGLNGCV